MGKASDTFDAVAAEAADLVKSVRKAAADTRWMRFGSWYRSAWRATAGWVCVQGLFVNLVVMPIARLYGFPGEPVEWGSVAALVAGLSALAGLRSRDLSEGTAS